MAFVRVRKAAAADAAGLVSVLRTVVAERVNSAIDEVWPVEQEARYLNGQSAREACFVAMDEDGEIVGFQVLDLWPALLPSMAHVGQVGTFLLPGWRRQGVGRQLWTATSAFAREHGYRKVVIQVRWTNAGARAFYGRLGFRECGRLTRQVVMDGVEEDEVLMECFL